MEGEGEGEDEDEEEGEGEGEVVEGGMGKALTTTPSIASEWRRSFRSSSSRGMTRAGFTFLAALPK